MTCDLCWRPCWLAKLLRTNCSTQCDPNCRHTGRIKLAGAPENPIAERTINAMEALVEMERHRELKTRPGTLAPQSPREAVKRYFDLPPLDVLPRWPQPIRGQKAFDYARDLA